MGPLPHQDPHKASHKGWCACDVREGDQGEGEARQNDREGLPSGCIEEADLGLQGTAAFGTIPWVCSPWESCGADLEGAPLALGHRHLQKCTSVSKLGRKK